MSAPSDEGCAEEQVGYRKPPKQHRFKKGVSGNPKGRPKRKKLSLGTVVAEELAKTVQITHNGERISVTRLQAIIMRATQDALTGTATERRLAAKFLAGYLPIQSPDTVPNGIVVRLVSALDEDL